MEYKPPATNILGVFQLSRANDLDRFGATWVVSSYFSEKPIRIASNRFSSRWCTLYVIWNTVLSNPPITSLRTGSRVHWLLQLKNSRGWKKCLGLLHAVNWNSRLHQIDSFDSIAIYIVIFGQSKNAYCLALTRSMQTSLLTRPCEWGVFCNNCWPYGHWPYMNFATENGNTMFSLLVSANQSSFKEE